MSKKRRFPGTFVAGQALPSVSSSNVPDTLLSWWQRRGKCTAPTVR